MGCLRRLPPFSHRYGSLMLDPRSGLVEGFIEKPQGDGGWIMVVSSY